MVKGLLAAVLLALLACSSNAVPNPAVVGSVDLGMSGSDIAVLGHYACVVNSGTSQLKVVDIANPAQPVLVGSAALTGGAEFVATSGNCAYAVTGRVVAGIVYRDLDVIDLSDPHSPARVAAIQIASQANGKAICTFGNFVIASMNQIQYDPYGSWGTLQVVDVADPAHPVLRSVWRPSPDDIMNGLASSPAHLYALGAKFRTLTINADGSIHEFGKTTMDYSNCLTVANGYACGGGYYWFKTIDISNDASPFVVGSIDYGVYGVPVQSVAGAGHYVCAGASSRFDIINIADPNAPTRIASIPMTGSVVQVATSGRYACVVNNTNNMFSVIDTDLQPRAPVVADGVDYAPGNTALSATWEVQDPSSIQEYQYAIGTSLANLVLSWRSAGTSTSAQEVVPGLLPGATYYWYVKARNDVDWSDVESTDGVTIDASAPGVSISSPTSEASYSTASATVDLAGTASDDIGVASVTWSNDRGGSGSCIGTTSWSATGIALQPGANVITVTATDAAGNTGTDSINVICDATAPSVQITSPTAEPTLVTTAPAIDLAGTASDNVGVTSVTWSNDRGGSGTCTPRRYARSENATDTIRAEGTTVQSGAATYETLIRFDQSVGSEDIHFYVEYLSGYVHKGIGISANRFNGYSAPINGGALYAPVTINPHQWYHLAYVYDGLEERLYVNGSRVAARPATGDVSDNPQAVISIGASPYGGGVGASFIGSLDALRVSSTARYEGAVFAPPIGDLAADANTQLLYNFNEPAGSLTVQNLSGQGHTGTLGTGFSGATSPVLVSDALAEWVASGIQLSEGINIITVTATDAAGNTGTDALTVTYTPLPSLDGHFYEAVAGDISFAEAVAAAQARTYEGLHGHLVTLTSADENAFVATAFPEAVAGGYWLGAYQDKTSPDYSVPADAWKWVTSEPWTYTNWHPDEPNDYYSGQGVNEDGLNFDWGYSMWNDAPTDPAFVPEMVPHGYVVEYQPDLAAPSVLITGPTTSPTIAVNTATIALAGTASDDVAIASVAWSNDRGGSGMCTGGNEWSSAGIALQEGTNVIAVTATDTSGKTGTDVLTVTYAPLPSINGHYYEAVAGDISFAEAMAAARARTYEGMHGHLVTLTSAEENSFVATAFPEAVAGGYWLGGYQDKTSADYGVPAGAWKWVTNEPWSYTNWHPDEPNDYYSSQGINEDGLNFDWGYSLWNDAPTDPAFVPAMLVHGYVVEYEPDLSAPTVTITTPTAEPATAVNTATIDLAGTAGDDVAVAEVRWANDRGGSGMCTGGNEWSATGIALHEGENVITVTATDTSGKTGTDVITVTLDTSGPAVTVTSPTDQPGCSIYGSAITLGGTAADSSGVASVTWANSAGGSGSCVGTTSWIAAGIPVTDGENTITVTAADALGNQATDTIVVTKLAGTGAVSIAEAKKRANNQDALLLQKAVTYATADVFYIEEDNRGCGIRVEKTGHGLLPGMRADVLGTMKTNTNKERYIAASHAEHDGDGEVKPLLMNTTAVGGAAWFHNQASGAGQSGVTYCTGLNNIGLLVKVCGRYTKVDSATFTVDDGTGLNIKCVVAPGVTLASSWEYVSVTGISSIYRWNSVIYPPVILIGSNADILPTAGVYEGEMIYIPAGEFLMGNSGVGDDATRGEPDELPQHPVDLASYYIGRHEVTRGEFRLFVNAGGYANPTYWSADGWAWRTATNHAEPFFWNDAIDLGTGVFVQTDNHPIITNYYEAEAFCNWAGGHLPTEAQWEKAARWTGSYPRVYPWGDTWDSENCNTSLDHNPTGGGYQKAQTAPVGSYTADVSSYGCQDMAGNLSEWCQEWAKSYPGSSSPFDYTNESRILRGGNWSTSYDWQFGVNRSASRGSTIPGGHGNGSLGFRLAR